MRYLFRKNRTVPPVTGLRDQKTCTSSSMLATYWYTIKAGLAMSVSQRMRTLKKHQKLPEPAILI